MRRILVVAVTICATVLGLSVPLQAAGAAARPKVTAHLSVSAGPLSVTPVRLLGRHLNVVTKVRFGGLLARSLRHVNSHTLAMRTPARRHPGRVPVRILVAGKWQVVSHYTYVARPVITRLSRSSSAPKGGGKLVVHGRNLAMRAAVTLGATKAPIAKRSATALTVTVPAGLPGAANVVVRTPGGTSGATKAAHFKYLSPAARDDSSYTPVDGTVTASGVQWVSGGFDATRSAQTANAPWIVSIGAGTDVPAVGVSYLLAPGGEVYPSGLSGTVTSVAAQQDGSTRLTIQPTALSDSFDDAVIDYSDGAAAAPGRMRTSAALPADQSTDFPHLDSSVFECASENGGNASFSGEIGLHFQNLSRQFSWSIRSPHVDAYVTGAIVTYGKVSAARAMTCKLKPSWVNAHRKVFFLGDSGATLSFGPAAEFTVSAGGTISINQTTHFMYGMAKYGSGPTQFYRVAREDPPEVSGSASVSVEVSVGLSMQIGILDRVGVELKPALFVEGELSLESHPVRVCANVNLGIKVSIDGFLDLWFKRWEKSAGTLRIEFGVLHKCTAPDSDVPPQTAPQITSATLTNATIGKAYSTVLQTADNRLGHWQLVTSLPPGLTLSGDGNLSGTPTGGVGNNYPQVVFRDAQNRTARATLLLRVLPDSGLGGGDIQATLTWSSPMDLDLHAIEPDGNEIFYANRGPSDNGGELDHDANAACQTVDPSPAENIHWPTPTESGTYEIAAEVYDECGADDLSWHLVVRVRGTVVIDQTGSGTSDWFDLNYSADTGTVNVRRTAHSATTLHAPKKTR